MNTPSQSRLILSQVYAFAAVFVVVMIFLAAMARGADASQDKVTICHKPGTPAEHTLVVAQPAVIAHLRHGDLVGPCNPGETPAPTPSPSAEPTTRPTPIVVGETPAPTGTEIATDSDSGPRLTLPPTHSE